MKQPPNAFRRFDDGLIVECRLYFDYFAFCNRLGAPSA